MSKSRLDTMPGSWSAYLRTSQSRRRRTPKEDTSKADPAASFAMPKALAEFEMAQTEEVAEQQAILDSIHSEAEANHHFLHQVDADMQCASPANDR